MFIWTVMLGCRAFFAGLRCGLGQWRKCGERMNAGFSCLGRAGELIVDSIGVEASDGQMPVQIT